MEKFVIWCNNTADLPEEEIKKHRLNVLPLAITIGDETYKDIPTVDFYEKLRAGAMPTTSAANIGECKEAFEPVLRAGCDVLCLALSSQLSATYDAFCMAARELCEEYPGRKIYVVDTVSASTGEALLILKAAQMRDEGRSIEETRDWVEENKRRVIHWFSVDDLKHLKRGGRISAATAAVGGMLNIKPILHVEDDGRLAKVDKVRGRRQSLVYMADKLLGTIINPEEQVVYIPHGDCRDDAEWLKEQILRRVKVKEVVVHLVGPVIAAHTGAGIMALIYMGTRRG